MNPAATVVSQLVADALAYGQVQGLTDDELNAAFATAITNFLAETPATVLPEPEKPQTDG
jgi:hypothetical protein